MRHTGFENRNAYRIATPPSGRRRYDKRFDRMTSMIDWLCVLLIAGSVVGYVLVKMLGY